MLVRKQIEIARLAILRELCTPVLGSRDGTERVITDAWGDQPSLVTLSVRSAFDLFLSERAWPEGSEIVMSGANVPDMAIIARHHGLRVRAVDFDLRDLAPDVEAFAQVVGERTCAIVFAHLFGSIVDVTPIARLARDRGIDLVEDAAQAFDGRYRGHQDATLSMFSFGPIKSVTALGGAVSTLRDRDLSARLRDRLLAQPVASSIAFRRRLAKYFLLISMSRPWALGAISRHLTRRGRDLDDLLAESARSFAGRDLIFAIRERPSAALLRLLAHRLRETRSTALSHRGAKGGVLSERLRDHVDIPGRPGTPHTYWVFPILCDNPAGLVAQLRSRGFDATRRATLAPIEPGLPRLERAFERLVYLPFASSHTDEDLERMADIIRTHARTRAIPGSYSGAV